jgi:predicted amidohydrolase YtcJ
MSQDDGHDRVRSTGISRRDVFRTGAAAGVVAAWGGALSLPAGAAEAPGGAPPGPGGDALTLVNGRIHTMDDAGTVARAVAMRNGRFVAVGNGTADPGPGGRVVNLHGRTVVPGLLESHTHYVSLANRPGYHVAQLELATNIDEVLALLAARRDRGDVPEGAFITSMGGWNPNQWAERRLPTLDELDEAVPDRPVFVFQRFNGPSRVNSLGKEFFENVVSPLAGPVTVGDDGSIASGGQSTTALYHLRVRQTFEDKKRSARDAMAFSAQVGVTVLLDQTLVAVGFGPRDPQPNHALATLDHFRMYDGWIDVHRDGDATVRLQINFLHNQGHNPDLGGLENQLPELRERLKNQFPFFGDDLLRTGGIGEWAAPFRAPNDAEGHAVWREAQRLVAQAGWRNENSQSGTTNIGHVIDAYEAVDAEFGITDLRWGLQHGDLATPEQLERLRALNVGVSASGFRWQSTAETPPASPVGPLLPQMVDSGVQLGLHEDGVHIAPHNPWFALHYAATGLNLNGVQINQGQQISRQQALHLYTRGNAWYLNREHDLGSIEVGKLADLVVLDKDYFTVGDEEMRRIRPVLTVVGGRVVHDTGEVA